MTDFSALRRKKSTLGSAPTMEEASTNLDAPEFAPAPPPAPVARLVEMPTRVDRRTLRRTGRVVQFATRVTPDFDEQFRALAERERLTIAELLEKMLATYTR